MTAFERKFPPQLAELPPARAALRAWLRDVGVNGEDATSDVLVVSSELVTNGVFTLPFSDYIAVFHGIRCEDKAAKAKF